MNSNKMFMVQLVLMVCALFLTTSIIFYFEISSLDSNGGFGDDDRFDRGKQMEIFTEVHASQTHTLGTELIQLEMGEVFECKDGSNKFAIMNDDYCDCADGSAHIFI